MKVIEVRGETVYASFFSESGCEFRDVVVVGSENAQVAGAGAYDRRTGYDALRERQARGALPPQPNAKIWPHGTTKAERVARDENLRRIGQSGRAAWKRECGAQRRSLAETPMFRLKTTCGDRGAARSYAGQAAQVLVRCATLNRLLQLGRPESYAA